ncbi:MAG: S-layer homology domain-containing protein, partial [Oscillospiraceae bacterium]|nr:S-layer homology domain-containing protein [Oscillospiraceae bacterium]
MKSKRILSLLLVLGMLASMLPSALAADVSDFTDVSESDWYYEYVDYVAEKGYFQGTSATTFSPAVTMTRAMFVTAVSRVAGETGDAGTAPFDDVPAGTWYTAAVDWATEHGVINGVGGNKFAPEREITREEMCVIMARFIAYLEESQKKTFKKDADPIDFPDADQIADYAKEAVDDCVAYGLVFGTGAGLMAPRALASRAEVAAMIYRLSLMTTESTGGGGGGGGGGGPVGPTATSHTINFMDGDEIVV